MDRAQLIALAKQQQRRAAAALEAERLQKKAADAEAHAQRKAERAREKAAASARAAEDGDTWAKMKAWWRGELPSQQEQARQLRQKQQHQRHPHRQHQRHESTEARQAYIQQQHEQMLLQQQQQSLHPGRSSVRPGQNGSPPPSNTNHLSAASSGFSPPARRMPMSFMGSASSLALRQATLKHSPSPTPQPASSPLPSSQPPSLYHQQQQRASSPQRARTPPRLVNVGSAGTMGHSFQGGGGLNLAAALNEQYVQTPQQQAQQALALLQSQYLISPSPPLGPLPPPQYTPIAATQRWQYSESPPSSLPPPSHEQQFPAAQSALYSSTPSSSSMAAPIPERSHARDIRRSGGFGGGHLLLGPSAFDDEDEEHDNVHNAVVDEDDDNPVLIAGSPWWRHDQQAVDMLKAVHKGASPLSSRARTPTNAARAAGASAFTSPITLPPPTLMPTEPVENDETQQPHQPQAQIKQRAIFSAAPVPASTSTPLDQPTPPSSSAAANMASPSLVRAPSSRTTASTTTHLPVQHTNGVSPTTATSSSTSTSPRVLPPPLPMPPSRDSAAQLRKEHIVRDVRASDGRYKSKLRKRKDESPLNVPTVGGEEDHGHASPSILDHPSRSGSPSLSAVHVLLQPSGSDRFWYSVVLASWPKMLHSSLLRKMIERDGVPPLLRHKVWSEMLAGPAHARDRSRAQSRVGLLVPTPQPLSSSPPQAALASTAHASTNHSSMSSDIQRMHAEPGRSDLPSTSSSASALADAPLSAPAENQASPSQVSASSSSSSTTKDAPLERCAFCSGFDPSSFTCSCPSTAGLLLPLSRPSAAACQLVLEGFVAAKEAEALSHGADGDDEAEAEVGYVQGMSYLAEVLLCSMPPRLAVPSLVGLFTHAFFRSFSLMDVDAISSRFGHFETTLALNAPMLASHFRQLGLPADCYYLEFLATLCAKQLPWQWIARVWDGYMLHGEVYILRCTIALLQLLQPILLRLAVSDLVRALREPASLDVFVVGAARSRAVSNVTAAEVTPVAESTSTPAADQPTATAAAPALIAPRAVFRRPSAADSAAVSITSPPTPEDEELVQAAAHASSSSTAGPSTSNSDEQLLGTSVDHAHVPHAASGHQHKSSGGDLAHSSNNSGGDKSKGFWWWPFSSKASSLAPSMASMGPPPHVAITLPDLLVGIQQVEVPSQVEEFCRQAQWKAHEHAHHQHHQHHAASAQQH